MPISNQRKQIKNYTQKLECFQKEIRSKHRFDKLANLRQQIQIEQEVHIHNMIERLPSSISDLLEYINRKKGFQKTISNLILNHIRSEIQSSQVYLDNLKMFVKSSSSECLQNQIDILFYLLQCQGEFAPLLLQKYFDFFYQECVRLNSVYLMFDCIYLVTKNSKLNWVPIKQIKFLIKKTKDSQKFTTCVQELNMYKSLAKNYPVYIQQNNDIVNRLIEIVDNMDKLFVHWKQSTILSLFISLSAMNQFKNPENNKITNFSVLLWSSEMLKHLKLNIFFKQKPKIKDLSLKLLGNLIIQNGSGSLWENSKLSFIQSLYQQIKKNQKNPYKTTIAMCKTFLMMIYLIKYKSYLFNILQSCQIDVIEFIFTIFQKFIQQKEIADLVVISLNFIADNLQGQALQNFKKRLIHPEIIDLLKKTQIGQEFIENHLKEVEQF